MLEEFEPGSYWMNEQEDLVLLVDIDEGMIVYSYPDQPHITYTTSPSMFHVFYRRLEPEEEGLVLLQNLE